jgi:pimeloyl-ACP methyl ester carboxylesterase
MAAHITPTETSGRLDRGDGTKLAWKSIAGRAPTIVFLPGFRSDMTGDKATALAEFATRSGQAMLRFDYSGHGSSDGDFLDGTIGAWANDALTAINELTTGKLILVGSSMGGWIALLTAIASPGRLAALVGIAAAPDFTRDLMWDAMMPAEQETIRRDGVLYVPSQYGDPTPITRNLIEDGDNHRVLTGTISITCPVRLLHGQADPDVPWQLALKIADQVESNDVQVILIKDGDHRLSRPSDLRMLEATIARLLQDAA